MEELLDQILRALNNAGIRAQAALPSKLIPRLKAPMTAVSIVGARAVEQGLGRYLGEEDDAASGRRAVYGRMLEATAAFRIASPVLLGGGRCFEEANALMDVLLAGIDGLQIREFSQEQCAYQPETDQFVCVVRAKLLARMLPAPAVRTEDDVADFILEGAIR